MSTLYNKFMIINDLDDFQLVKYLLNQEYCLQKDLNEKLNEKLESRLRLQIFPAS